MNEPLVTIGIPFYKDVDTLEYAVKSVLKQTYKNWYMILIDDGGKDGSLKIVQKYLDDSRIRLISDGKNKGLPSRLNELIELAEGKYFARMDADDIMHPKRIEKQVAYLEKNPQVDVLGTGAYSLSIDNNILGLKLPKLQECFTEHDLFMQKAIIHPTVMAKTRWYKDNKYCEDSFAVRAEDFELWCRSWPYTKFANLSEPLIYYREGNSIKKSLNNQMLTYDNTVTIINKYAPRYLSTVEIKKLVRKIYIKKMIWRLLHLFFLDSVFAKRIFKRRFLSLSTETEKESQKILNDILYY